MGHGARGAAGLGPPLAPMSEWKETAGGHRNQDPREEEVREDRSGGSRKRPAPRAAAPAPVGGREGPAPCSKQASSSAGGVAMADTWDSCLGPSDPSHPAVQTRGIQGLLERGMQAAPEQHGGIRKTGGPPLWGWTWAPTAWLPVPFLNSLLPPEPCPCSLAPPATSQDGAPGGPSPLMPLAKPGCVGSRPGQCGPGVVL